MTTLNELLNIATTRMLTDAEHEELMDQLRKYNQRSSQLFSDGFSNLQEARGMDPQTAAFMLEAITATQTVKRIAKEPAPRIHLVWFRVAAAILLVAGIGAYLWKTNTTKEEITTSVTNNINTNILAGTNKAVLTLSDNRKIELDNATGEIINDGGLAIKNDDGQLNYAGSMNSHARDKTEYNTMTTPRGGQYKIILADGTQVWLNAASSITYPTVFTGNKRTVVIEGEAYLEVTKDAKKPFIVKSGKQEITVLGTSFNVNNYPDEPVQKTSLISGSIKVNNRILIPGQAYAGEKIIPTNIQQDIAWKNGYFNFDGADLSAIMRQVARWYDLEIIYEKEIPAVTFVGKMTRNISLKGALSVLQQAGVKFRMEGQRKLIITP